MLIKTTMGAVLGVLLAPAGLRAQEDAKPAKVTPPSTVPILVRERKGEPVADLPQTAFTVKFDGKPLPLTEVAHGASQPVTYGLLVDVGAGQRNSVDDVRKAARAFLSGLRPGDRMFVVQFSKDIELLQAPTGDRPKLERAISEIGTSSATFHAAEPREDTLDSEGRKVHHGGTSLDDAIFLASDDVLGAEKSSRHVLIVFSDGADDGSKESAGDMLEAVMRNHVVIYGVFSRNADELTRKAREESRGTGGHGQPGGGTGSGRTGYPFPGTGGGGYPGQYPGSQQPGSQNPNGSGPGSNKPGATPSRRPDVDGLAALKKLSEETGGRVAEYKERGAALSDDFLSVAVDLQAMYWVSFTPQGAATRHGVHPFDVNVAGQDKSKKVDVQTSDDFYVE